MGEAGSGEIPYPKRTMKSLEMFERAKKVEPGGVSYRYRHFDPYPFFVKQAKGATLQISTGMNTLTTGVLTSP